ncbi:MAG: tyrosine-type recombinase/integrase, partial [Pirellulaceae bacterium]
TGSVRLFQKFLDRDPDLSSVTRNDLRKFILDLQQRPAWQGHPTIHGSTRRVSKTAINTYARGIRAFFATLEREEFIAPHDIAKARVPKAPIKQIVPFTESELKAIFGAIGTKGPLSARNRAMALLLLDPGLRVSEACGLSDDDVDLSEMQITVTGKGGRDRLLPLSRWATKALLVYKVKARPEPLGCDNFFLTKEGIPVSPSAVEQMLTRVGNRTGVRGVTPHRFRHSFALLFLRNGGDSFHLQRLLGHSTLEMTRRYTRLADVDIKEAHRKFSPSDRLRL